MAEIILPKIAPPLDEDRISYEEAEAAGLCIVANGSLPSIPTIIPRRVPGTWHVEMRNHGLSLGAIADGFENRESARAWANEHYRACFGEARYGGYVATCIYTPTPEDLKLLASAPRRLDVGSVVIEYTRTEPSGESRELAEQWASREEAARRVASLAASGVSAKPLHVLICDYSRTVEELRSRREHISSINGDTSKHVDGSFWDLPEWKDRAGSFSEPAPIPREDGQWQLTLYTKPQLRTFYSEYYSAKRTLATPIRWDGFNSEESAWHEGFRRMRSNKEFVAASVWHPAYAS